MIKQYYILTILYNRLIIIYKKVNLCPKEGYTKQQQLMS